MGLNDPVNVDLTQKVAVLILDTGVLKNEKPVLKRIRFPVLSTATNQQVYDCLLYTSPSPRDRTRNRMPSSA